MDEKNGRLNQWFIRGIGIISAILFGMIFFLVFLEVNQDSFYSGPNTTELGFAQLGQEIGQNIWTFRVYDIILLLVLIVLAIVGSYYLVNFEAVKKPKNLQQHYRRQY